MEPILLSMNDGKQCDGFFLCRVFMCSKANARVSDALNSMEIRVHRWRTSNSFHYRRWCDAKQNSQNAIKSARRKFI